MHKFYRFSLGRFPQFEEKDAEGTTCLPEVPPGIYRSLRNEVKGSSLLFFFKKEVARTPVLPPPWLLAPMEKDTVHIRIEIGNGELDFFVGSPRPFETDLKGICNLETGNESALFQLIG